ncbi:MAG: hypothetical protein QF561_05340 [Phycisphaerales bacterium]|nr:hypothetical protein [Phycisphaerales bacterium]
MRRVIRTLVATGLAGSAGIATAQSRLETPRLGEVRGVQGVSGYHGVGDRRSLPNQFQFRNSAVSGRQFERSFNMTTDQEFRDHNIDNVAERLRSESLYNNPWYWQNIGSLETELMTGGSGLAFNSSQADGDYYNPYFYDQWKTSLGQRHSGAMTSEIGRPPARSQMRASRGGDGPAELPGTNEPLSTEPQEIGMLAADRTVLSGDRLGTTLRSDIDDSWSGRLDRQMGMGMTAERKPVRYLASELRGLATAPAGSSAFDMGLSSFDLARMRDDSLSGRRMSGLGMAWDTNFKDLAIRSEPMDTRMSPHASPLPSSPGLEAAHQAMADRYASLHPASKTLEERLAALDADYRRLRGELVSGATLPAAEEPLVPETALLPETPAATPSTTPEPGSPPDGTEPEPTILLDRPPPMKLKDYGLVLRHGQRMESLARGDGSRFDDLLAAGSQKLADQDYFWAERRFNRALRFISGHPLAMVGLGHSQLGAGLYLSAALTLQSLLAFQPEMIDVVYATDLLPSQDDLDRAISTLTERLRGERDLDRYGFLLAYIGHQLERPDLVREGLDAMRRGGGDQEFRTLLEEVWGPPIQADEPE